MCISISLGGLHCQVEYNLYGMGFVRLRKACFRGPLPVRGMTTRAGWDSVPEVISYEEASTGGLFLKFCCGSASTCPPKSAVTELGGRLCQRRHSSSCMLRLSSTASSMAVLNWLEKCAHFGTAVIATCVAAQCQVFRCLCASK